ncbi:MAG: DrmE family protein, partial [Bacteroidota bacterium]
VKRMSNYLDEILEISYPPGINSDIHHKVQQSLHFLFDSSDLYGNNELKIFSKIAASLSNRVFQSPVSVRELDSIFSSLAKKTVGEEISVLGEKILFLSGSALPDDFENKARMIIENLSILTTSYYDYWGRCESIALDIAESPNVRSGIVVKYPEVIPSFIKKLEDYLIKIGVGNAIKNVIVSDNVSDLNSKCERLLWTYKPRVMGLLMLNSRTGLNRIFVYPLQKKELEQSITINSHKYEKYSNPEYRANVLKIPLSTYVGDGITLTQSKSVEDSNFTAFDLEELMAKVVTTSVNYSQGWRGEVIDAKVVLFENGKKAFFQKGNKIKTIDREQESIEVVTVEKLSKGDEVIFLGDSKRTIFDELVVFYEHKPEMIDMVRKAEIWRSALINYCNENKLDTERLKWRLQGFGLKRHELTLENWLEGLVICPDEGDYAPLSIIAEMTGNQELKLNLDQVKYAAKTIHSLRIKIGHYLSKKITQSYISPDSLDDDPILKGKLDEISSKVIKVKVSEILEKFVKIPLDMTNKLLDEDF